MKLEKTTKVAPSKTSRRFGEACGLAHGLELVGERWALLVVRELLLGPRRFSDIRADLPAISANVLSQRLSELEARGIVTRLMLPPPARVQVYGLTAWGLEAEPMILAMARWAMRSPTHDRTMSVNRVSILLSMKVMIDLEKIGDLRLVLGFRFGDAVYRGRLDATGLQVEAGEAAQPDLIYTGHPRGLTERVYGKAPLDHLAAQGTLHMIGDVGLEARFVDLFALPQRACLAGPDADASAA